MTSAGSLDTGDGTVLLEREEELGRLEALIGAACAGKGGLLLVEGPAGIGKSALLDGAAGLAAEQGMTRLAARATEIERELPFGAVRQLLEGHLRALPAARRRELFAGSAAPAAAALGLDAPPPRPLPDSAVVYGLHWLVANLAERKPLLLALDDAQWADPDSARFLAHVAPRLAELSVLLLVAARSEEAELSIRLAATASDPAARPIVPRPLSPAACAAIASSSFPGVVAPQFAQACHRASGGNPFYLRALLDELRREGVEPTASAGSRALTLGPQAVTRVLVARLAGLPPAAGSVARAAAVLGDDSSFRLVARLAGVEPAGAADAIDRLAAAGILDSGEPLRFAHPIVRNAVYAEIGRRERSELHRRAAALLAAGGAAPERPAAHLLASDPVGEQGTVDALREAAEDAIGRGAPAAAVAYLRRALAEPPADRARGEVLLELGNAELTTDGAAARDRLQQVLETTEPPEERISVVRSLVAAHLKVGELGELGDLLRGEIERAPGVDPGLVSALEADLVIALLVGPDAGALRDAHERVERLAPGLAGSTPAERVLLSCLAYSRLCRGLPVAEAVAPAKLRLASAPEGERSALASPDWVMALGVLLRCGEIDAAERAARDRLEQARASGSLYALAGVQWVLGVAAECRGRLGDAAAWLETALRGAREFGAVSGVHTSLFSLVAVDVERGELRAAASALAAEGLGSGPVEAVATPGELLESRARLRLAEGDPAAALADFERVASIARERGDLGPGMTLWRAGATLAHLRLGDGPRARELAREEVARARRFGGVRQLGGVLVVAARTEEGEPGTEMLREAAELLEGSPFRIERARALVDLGARLRRAGQRRAAREPLGAGLRIARSCGATPLAARAFEELRASGARPRKVLRTGVDALTPSEARVARLAAEGKSNREIAEELFVSHRTVEFHLRQVFVKLAIRSRSELPAALAEE